jgi:hypothetical protein
MIAILLLAAGVGSDSAPAQYLADPYQIFARARGYWLERSYPPLLEYDVAVTVLEGGTVKTQRYWSAYDSVDQQIAVDPVSDYEHDHPTYAASGFNFVLRGPDLPIPASIGKPQPPTDYLGIPLLAPNYTFGMANVPPTNPAATPGPMAIVHDVRNAFHDPDPHAAGDEREPDSDALPVIERETVYDRVYRVTLDGIEPTYGVAAYHLRLQALRNPGRYRLEELWVDARSFAPIQLVERMNFSDGPGTGVPWRVRFERIGNGLYVYDETALQPMRYGGLVYPQASVAFEDLHAVDQLSRFAPFFVPQAPLIMTEPTFSPADTPDASGGCANNPRIPACE